MSWKPEIVDLAKPYYEMDFETAVQVAQEKVDEWEYSVDKHGYCHDRAILVKLLEAVQKLEDVREELVGLSNGAVHVRASNGNMIRVITANRVNNLLDRYCPTQKKPVVDLTRHHFYEYQACFERHGEFCVMGLGIQTEEFAVQAATNFPEYIIFKYERPDND